VIGDEKTLFPDNEALLEATRVLVKEGFVLPTRTTTRHVPQARGRRGRSRDAPRRADRLGLGIQNPNNIRIIREQAGVPVIVDAGVGTASDATFRDGARADAVLMNTAIALARIQWPWRAR